MSFSDWFTPSMILGWGTLLWTIVTAIQKKSNAIIAFLATLAVSIGVWDVYVKQMWLPIMCVQESTQTPPAQQEKKTSAATGAVESLARHNGKTILSLSDMVSPTNTLVDELPQSCVVCSNSKPGQQAPQPPQALPPVEVVFVSRLCVLEDRTTRAAADLIVVRLENQLHLDLSAFSPATNVLIVTLKAGNNLVLQFANNVPQNKEYITFEQILQVIQQPIAEIKIGDRGAVTNGWRILVIGK